MINSFEVVIFPNHSRRELKFPVFRNADLGTLWFRFSCNPKDDISAFIIAISTIGRVFLPFRTVESFVLVLNTEFCRLEENHDRGSHVCMFRMLWSRNYFPLLRKIGKGPKHNRYQRNLWGVGKRQFLSSIFKGPLSSFSLQGSSYAPSATPIHEINGINSEK